MYDVEFTQGAVDDLRFLKKNEQQQVIAGIESQLLHEPNVETRNRKRHASTPTIFQSGN